MVRPVRAKEDFNHKEVPFGSGKDRFPNQWPINVMPGPGAYATPAEWNLSTASTARKGNQGTVSFKSQAPKIALY